MDEQARSRLERPWLSYIFTTSALIYATDRYAERIFFIHYPVLLDRKIKKGYFPAHPPLLHCAQIPNKFY